MVLQLKPADCCPVQCVTTHTSGNVNVRHVDPLFAKRLILTGISPLTFALSHTPIFTGRNAYGGGTTNSDTCPDKPSSCTVGTSPIGEDVIVVHGSGADARGSNVVRIVPAAHR